MVDGWLWLVVGVRQRRVVVKKEELSALVYQALECYLMHIFPQRISAMHRCGLGGAPAGGACIPPKKKACARQAQVEEQNMHTQ